MFIEATQTPNPNAMKFCCQRPISPKSPVTFLSIEDCGTSSLANKLFLLDGVMVVFFGHDFITLTKAEDCNWSHLKPTAILTIIDHFNITSKIFDREKTTTQEANSFLTNDAIEQQIIQILEEYIRPAIAMDGGDLIYHGFQDGVVKLTLIGACRGCPSSEFTLKQGVLRTLQYNVPEVVSVMVVDLDNKNSNT